MSIVIGYLGANRDRHPSLQRRRRPPPAEPAVEYTPTALQEAVSVGALRSEQQRAEVGALNQAIQGAETALAVVDWAARGVGRIDGLVTVLHDAVDASLGDASGTALDTRKRDIRELLRQIDQVARTTRFGEQGLLDGGLGATGEATGQALEFVAASHLTRSSPAEGYPVLVSRAPRRARLVGERPLEGALLRRRIRFRIREGPRQAEAATRGGETAEEIVTLLRQALRRGGLELAVGLRSDGRLWLHHVRYGPDHGFTAESSAPGVLSRRDGQPGVSLPGWHVAGTLNGEPAEGWGELLTGLPQNRTTAGLTVAYTGPIPVPVDAAARDGPDPPVEPVEVGRVIVVQRGLALRLGPQEELRTVLAVPSLEPLHLGRRVFTHSGYGALAEIEVDSVRQARDALMIVGRAQEEVRRTAESVRAVRDGPLSEALAALRVRAQNLAAGEAAIGDPRFAAGLAAHVSDRLWSDQGLAMQAQPQLAPGAVLRLIN